MHIRYLRWCGELSKDSHLRQLFYIRIFFLVFGATNAFIAPAMVFYLVDELKASPHIQATITVITGVAWNLKMLMAFASDSVPLCGYHRQSYMQIGLVAYMLAYFLMCSCPPSIPLATVLLFAANWGEMVSSVMLDTLVVEAMWSESKEAKGTLQTHCFMLLTFGSVAGTLLGGIAIQSWASVRTILLVNAVLKAPALILACMLKETGKPERKRYASSDHNDTIHMNPSPDGGHVKIPLQELDAKENSFADGNETKNVFADDSFSMQQEDDETLEVSEDYKSEKSCKSRALRLWNALTQKRIFKPSFFIFTFSVMPDAGAAMRSFYIVELKFTPSMLALTMVIGGIAGICGMYSYNRWFKRIDWKVFFATVIVLATVVSLTQLILVFRINKSWGIPDYAFALGDLIILDVAKTLIGLPILILVASLCPVGVQGSVFAAVTSVQIAGGTISGTLSAMLIQSLGITLNDYKNLWKLVVICATIRLVVVPMVFLLPSNLEALPVPDTADKLQEDTSHVDSEHLTTADGVRLAGKSKENEYSKCGGGILITLLVVGVAWGLGQATYNLQQVQSG